ncbi:hypothetical protein [Kribbella sp. NPDC004536]|uniref:hypothetical protein n=1 Tax=Kribbella sp. NPDC004536 TaxID=3364106 RepID=UPI0036CD3408
MSAEVTVTRGELSRVRELIQEALTELDGLIGRETTEPPRWTDTGSGPGYEEPR